MQHEGKMVLEFLLFVSIVISVVFVNEIKVLLESL